MDAIISAAGFGVATAAIIALGAVGFSMQFAVTNILNIAYGSVMIASAFAVYYMTTLGVNVWMGLPIGAIVGALLSYLINKGIYSRFGARGIGLSGMVIVTLGVGIVLQNILLALSGITYLNYNVQLGANVHVGAVNLTTAQLVVIGIAIVAMLLTHFLLVGTKLGKAMRATSSNPSLARACGIHTQRVVDVAWVISGALCGLAGVTLGISLRSFQASSGSDFLVIILAAAVLGGIGQPYGAMLGALVVGLVTEISTVFIDPGYKNGVAFVVLVLFLVFRPSGLLGRDMSGNRELVA